MVGALPSVSQLRAWLDAVPDPEMPMLSITDLGIVREVAVDDAGATIVLTPTYSGCPATEAIAHDVVAALHSHGVERVHVTTRLSPPWSTDWISPRGRARLREYGIAPPAPAGVDVSQGPIASAIVRCPRCHASATRELSRFGSTPCKALYRCERCAEPFEYVKPL